jgi:hypothetical protein
MLWEFSDISETELRVQALGLFSGTYGRSYWNRYGQMRLHNDNTKKEREFDRLLDSVYREVAGEEPNVVEAPSPETTASIEQTSSSNRFAGLGVTLICGVAIGWLARAARKNSWS